MTHVRTHERRCIELEKLILEERAVKSDLEISFLRRSRDPLQEGEDRHSCSAVESPDNANLRYHQADRLGSKLLLLLLSVINCIQYHYLLDWIVSSSFQDARGSA